MNDLEDSRPSGDAPSLQVESNPGGPFSIPIIQPNNDDWAAALADCYRYILSDEWGQDARIGD